MALVERASEYREYSKSGQTYDEFREGYGGDVEYRYAEFPLALGEVIMMNHALFSGLLHAGATPITDDPFHSQALAHKLKRAASEPAIHQVICNRAAQRQLKADALAAAALMDTQIQLPILDPALPLAEILEYRQIHAGDLQQARQKLGWMARRIEEEPWNMDFAKELEHKTIPDIAKELEAARKARDSWLKSKQGRLVLPALSAENIN